jgi:hypothetical protein
MTHSLFWGIRTNDEGSVRPDSYLTLAVKGKIEVVAPARAVGFALDGKSVLLDTGKTIEADVVILATGYQSSWSKIISSESLPLVFLASCLNGNLSDKMADEIGINKHSPSSKASNTWNYPSLYGAPEAHPQSEQWITSIYRGIVPAKNILRRDFAVAGALV